MSVNTLDRIAAFVTQHNRVTILVMLLLTGVMVAGMGMIETGDPAEEDIAFNETEVGQALEYLQDNYEDGEEDERSIAAVYVDPDGNALAQQWVVRALAYQETVHANETVQSELTDDGVTGVPNALGEAVAGPDAGIGAMREAVAALDSDDYEAALTDVLSDADLARAHLPASYEVGSTESESMRILFSFEETDVDQQRMPVHDDAVQHALFEAAEDDEALFTVGQFAAQGWVDQQFGDTIWLILPAALLLVLSALAIAYRDIVDVIIGFFGVIVSVLWFFGIVGWLGIPADFSLIVGPVLIVALSIDFGLHVFMRYREQREVQHTPVERTASDTTREHDETVDATEGEHLDRSDGIRPSMRRATASVAVAFLLVAVTAGIGFGSNVTSPMTVIQQFGVAITLGVVAAFLVFVTLVPALKVSADGLLERFGFDRQKTPLGTTGVLRPVLSAGVTAARRGAVVVVVIALLAGVAGGIAYTELDRQGFQNELTDDDDWRTALPSPIGWEAHEHEFQQNLRYTQEQYQAESEGLRTTAFLLRGEVATTETLDRISVAQERVTEYDTVFTQGGVVALESPLTVMEQVAAENESFAAVYDEYDPAGDLDDEEVVALFDALFEADTDAASEVIARIDGEYRSVLITVPVESSFDPQQTDEEMHALAGDIEGDTALSVIPVGSATLTTAELGAIADGIFEALLLALGGVLVLLAVVYRVARGSATLGAVTVVPIALVMGLVFGGMYLLGIPLTFLTAFLVAITIGLGIDYNIHISDRFAQELERGRPPVDALYTTVRGTGGALFGSALTSGAAFATIALHPHPQFNSLGLIVVLALVLSFLVSVFVLPSMLYLWANRQYPESALDPAGDALAVDD